MNNKTEHGGFRPGAGRKPGVKTSKNTTVFYAKCTEEEKQKLKDYLKNLRSLIVLFVLMFFIAPVFAWNVEAPANLPEGIHINIEPGFVYAGGIHNDRFRTPNSFKISAYTDGGFYSFDMNDAAIIIDGREQRLIEPTSYQYIYNEEAIPQTTIFKGPRRVFPFYVTPIENLRCNNGINKYEKPVKLSLIGGYVFPVKFNYKESVLKDKAECFIKLPLFNKDTFQTTNLVFKIIF